MQNIFDFALCLLPSTGGNILICEILWKHVNVVHFSWTVGESSDLSAISYQAIAEIASGVIGYRIVEA